MRYGIFVALIDVLVGFVWHIYSLGGHGMACSEWSLSRSLWKKVRKLEKSTPAVLVALVTNYSYDFNVQPHIGACANLEGSLDTHPNEP